MNDSTQRKFAVVTGASSGIGLELAKQFSEHGFDLLVTAEDSGIKEAAVSLGSLGTDITEFQVDLATPEGVEKLYEKITSMGRPLDAIALNAGVGAGGDFARGTALEADLNVIDLNVRSTVHLAKLVLRDMVARNEGKILFTSSIAATMPGTFNAVYNASKAFVQSFAQAIRNELKDTQITITALMPGPTDTNFFERANWKTQRWVLGRRMTRPKLQKTVLRRSWLEKITSSRARSKTPSRQRPPTCYPIRCSRSSTGKRLNLVRRRKRRRTKR